MFKSTPIAALALGLSVGHKWGMRCAFLLPMALMACTQFPDLDAAVTDASRNADYPALIPIEPVLAQVPTQRVEPSVLQQTQDSRVAALKARADRLRRTPVIDGATRRRMAQGAG
ncbi:MAG: hypothetical protein AAF218_09810 [Pseudomonadota bacterium]